MFKIKTLSVLLFFGLAGCGGAAMVPDDKGMETKEKPDGDAMPDPMTAPEGAKAKAEDVKADPSKPPKGDKKEEEGEEPPDAEAGEDWGGEAEGASGDEGDDENYREDFGVE